MTEASIQKVAIPADAVRLQGDLANPKDARGVVLFAHGSGSSRLSPRNQEVAGVLQQAGFGTLLFDLLTEREAAAHDKVFAINLLARRLACASRWLSGQRIDKHYPLGYFGASTGAAAALVAAARDHTIRAVVARGGRPDLALRQLADVRAPTLLIVGGNDHDVMELNAKAYRLLRCVKELKIVPGATHLFQEPGVLAEVAKMAAAWFSLHLPTRATLDPTPPVPAVFADRAAAGRRLADDLMTRALSDVVVLGIPRGGLPVALKIAQALRAPLDVIVARKLGAPGQPELGIGAVVDGDQPSAIFNQDIIEQLGVSEEYIKAEIARQLKEVSRRESAYRGGRAKTPLAGKSVILVDDGIATGSSIRAALRGVRRQKPHRLILAVPVAPAPTIAALRSEVDEIVCLATPADFFAVGQFYRDFHQVTDAEVKAILQMTQPAPGAGEAEADIAKK